MQRIACWVMAIVIQTLVALPGAWAADDGRLFIVSSVYRETAFVEGLSAPSGDQNVYALLTNSNCGQSGFHTLLSSRVAALHMAVALSRRLNRQTFIYEVRQTQNMYSVAASVANNVDQISPEMQDIVLRLGTVDRRWLTPVAIEPADIFANYYIDPFNLIEGFPAVHFRINHNYVFRDPIISRGGFTMPPQPQAISNNYIRLARLEGNGPLVNACSVSSFECGVNPSRMLLHDTNKDQCLAADDFETVPMRVVYARRIYAALMPIFE